MTNSRTQQAALELGDSQSNQPSRASRAGRIDSSQVAALRRESLAAINHRLDEYLRSPDFLQAMKQNIDALIRAKQEGSDEAVARQLDPDRGYSRADTVYREGSLRLLRYCSIQPSRYAEPIVVCFALVNRPYILDLNERRSVVQQLLRAGFDVYLIDWGEPGTHECELGLEDYVCGLMKQVVGFVTDQANVKQLHLLGYCMGGTMATMYASLYPTQVSSLTLLAAPVDFSGDEGLLNLWSREEYFDVDGLIDAYANCPGKFLHCCFQLMKPATTFVEKFVTLGENLDNPAFLDNFLAVERWSNDSIAVAGKTFRQFVKLLYRKNLLVAGQLELDGAPVRLRDIVCPTLLLVADHDHLTPPRATLALLEHIASTDVQTMTLDAGHIGLAVSAKAHQVLWPAAADWIADRSTAREN